MEWRWVHLGLAVGTALCGYGVWCFLQKIRALRWPTVPGVILSAHVDSELDADGSPSSREAIQYKYVVNGQPWIGRHVVMAVDFRMNSGDWSTASDRFARYGVGREVSVRYNPANPKEAYLEIGSQTGNVLAIAIGAAVLVASWLKW